MDADKTVVATFTPISVPEYTLTVNVVGNGSVTPSSGTYPEGTAVALTATPADGWHVAGWSGTNDDSGTSTENTLIMPAGAHTASITFERTDTGEATTKTLKKNARRALAELLPTDNVYDDWQIRRAIRYVDRSLASRYWVDDEHLTYRGTWVFYFEKMAVRYLMRASSVESPVNELMIALVHVDQTLAQTALNEAQSAGGNPNWIARAEIEMEKALYDLARERPSKAIDHYRRAWGYSILSQWLFRASIESENGADSMDEFMRRLEADEFLYLPVIR